MFNILKNYVKFIMIYHDFTTKNEEWKSRTAGSKFTWQNWIYYTHKNFKIGFESWVSFK